MKEVLGWGVVTKDIEEYWYVLSGPYTGRISIYETKKQAMDSKGELDKIVRVRIGEYIK